MQIIIRDYFLKIYANKLENLEEMKKILNMYELSKLNTENI